MHVVNIVKFVPFLTHLMARCKIGQSEHGTCISFKIAGSSTFHLQNITSMQLKHGEWAHALGRAYHGGSRKSGRTNIRSNLL